MLKNKQKGQALLIILLIMAVVLTIALSVVSRSVTDISITQKEEEAARAYSAAEAGVERTLLTGSALVSESLPSGDLVKTTISSLAQNSREFLVPLYMSSGETTPVWFVSHNQSGEIECSADFPCFTGSSIKLCWGEKDTPLSNTTPALELSILHTTSTDYSTAKVSRAVFDPFIARADNNNFEKGSEGSSCVIEGKNLQFSKTVDLSSLNVTLRTQVNEQKGPQMARLRLLYNTDRAHPIGLMVNSQEGAFPKQGSKVESSGQSGQATRKVQVYQLYPDLPPVFDYGIFSGTGGITK